jgi:hypothetical protein
MTRKYWESIDEPEVSLPGGWYDVEITAARTIESNDKMIFMDLLVLRGPDKGSVTSVSLYCPEDGEKAVFYFKSKTVGFAPALKQLAAKQLDDDEQVSALAGLLEGLQVSAFLGIQKDGSQFAGRQELLETRPIDGAVAAAAPLAAAEPAAESNGSGEDAEVVELRRKLAEAESKAPAAAGDDELPF